MVVSQEPDATVLPSALRATLVTLPLWPVSVDVHAPEPRSHTLGRAGGGRPYF